MNYPDDIDLDDALVEDGDVPGYWSFEEAIDNCGYIPSIHLCTKAGSEECDFDCPLYDILFGEVKGT